jgi:TolB-like protein
MVENSDHSPTPPPSPSPEGLVAGRSFGPYTLIEEVGRGGMGVVWKAHHPILHREEALKFLSPQLARSEEARERFIREARSASALKHSGIATVYGAGETDGKVYIAQEFIDGTTVSELVTRGPLAAAEAFRVAIMAGRAIGYAHGRGVLHRDVTSRNLMITRDGNVVVVDFGLAVVQGETRFTRSGAVVGTLPYMAPELFTGGKASEATDVYGLGVVLYEMLTGSVPFQEKYEAALMWVITNRDPDAPSARVEGLDPEVDRIIAKALAKDPSVRHPSAEVLVADLESLLQTGVLPDVAPDQALVRPSQPIPSMPRRSRVRKTTVIGFLAGLALLAFVAVRWGPSLFDRSAKPAFASVAVLPFEVVGPADQIPDWMLTGLGEQLTAKLAKLEGCRVVTWASSRNFSAKDLPIHDIAKELGVEAVVLVSVRSNEGKLAGSVSLVEGSNEFVKSSSDFEQLQSDLFAIERALAVAVTEGLFGRVTGQANRVLSVPSAQSADAYEFYLKGANAMQEETPEATSRALAFFERAQQLDPQLADAYVGAGAAHKSRNYFGWGSGAELDQAEADFEKAWELDRNDMAALRGLIIVAAERSHLEKGLQLGARVPINEHSTIDQLMTRAQSYFGCGLPAKSVPLYQRVIAIEPSHQAAHFLLVVAYEWSGEHMRCIEQGETYFSKFGEDAEIHIWVGNAHDWLGNVEEASVHYRRALDMLTAVSGESHAFAGIADFFMRTGRPEIAQTILDNGIEQTRHQLAAAPGNARLVGALAEAYAVRGDRERFLEMAEQFRVLGVLGAVEIAWGYARVGREDLAVAYLCELAEQRAMRSDYLVWGHPASALQSILGKNERAKTCFEETQRWFEDLAQRY